MNRRELVSQGALTLGAASFAAEVLTAKTAAAAGAKDAWERLAESTSKCIAIGLDCATHCRKMMAQGDKAVAQDMAQCQAAVNDMLASCEAVQKLVASRSSHTAAHAKACADVCTDCAKICAQHAKMDICKRCEAACKDCIEACKAVA